jgi:hypothetical protein
MRTTDFWLIFGYKAESRTIMDSGNHTAVLTSKQFNYFRGLDSEMGPDKKREWRHRKPREQKTSCAHVNVKVRNLGSSSGRAGITTEIWTRDIVCTKENKALDWGDQDPAESLVNGGLYEIRVSLPPGSVLIRTTNTSVSQPPGRGPVPGIGINYNRPREVPLEFVILVF